MKTFGDFIAPLYGQKEALRVVFLCATMSPGYAESNTDKLAKCIAG